MSAPQSELQAHRSAVARGLGLFLVLYCGLAFFAVLLVTLLAAGLTALWGIVGLRV